MSGATKIRLDRLLANLGYGSRRDIEILARAGRLRLGDELLRDASIRVTADAAFGAALTVDGEELDPLPGMVLMMHKPIGVTCSHKESGKLVYALLPERFSLREPALSTVGRLDKDTSGLLLLTDDGALLHKIISPRHQTPKIYRASLAEALRDDAEAVFASGTLMLEGEEKPLLPAGLERLSEREVLVTISEGRYHQVRRMFAALGNHVEQLVRIAIGGLKLPDDLLPGESQLLGPDEIALIFSDPAA